MGQVEEQFGDQGSYLIDFYHVCEYLSAAAEAIAPAAAARETWIEAQKDALRDGRLEMTLRSLVGHCEAPEVDDEQAPVRRCHRYLSSRKNQLNYRQALAEGLPIGSGEIESAHRYVAQQRLKRPGAWWRVEHAEYMLALRITRINGDWDAYWKNLGRSDPMFKMALDLPPSDRELCSQSTISRLENLPDARALLRMGRAMVALYCASFHKVPKRITLDIDDTFDAVHGGQQLRLFNAHYDEYGFQPIVVFDGEGRFITAVLRPAKRPTGRGRSEPSCAGCCARSAPIGPTPRSCCAPTAIIVAPRFSTGVGRAASITSSASRRLRRCAGMSKVSKPA